MSSREEMRARGLELLEQQRRAQREAELARLAAPASTGDLEALGNRVYSAIAKLATAVDRLRSTQSALARALQALDDGD